MKKLLTVLTSFAAMTTIGSSVVSCIAPAYARGPEGQRVVFITDGGNIADKSFNESALKAIQKYSREIDFYNQELFDTKEEFENIEPPERFETFEDWKKAVDASDIQATAEWNEMLDNRFDNDAKGSYDSSTNYVEAKDSSAASLKSAYKMAQFLKPDAVVIAGFVHLGEIEAFANSIPDTSIILADSMVDYSGGKNKNIISINFNSELAGFAAAIDAGIWALQNPTKADINGDGIIRVGTFGGISAKYSTDNYMWGLLAGFNVMNSFLKPDSTIKFESANEKTDFENISVKSASDSLWYSNSFGLGDATKTGLVDELLNKGKADIVFPVAGIQILDVLSSNISQPYMIGVDTNQVYSYNTYKDRFLSSAIKNLEFSISDELREAKSLKTIDGYDGQVNEDRIGQVSVQDTEELLDYADGHVVSTKANWSINATGGDNIIQQTAINYDEDEMWLRNVLIEEFAKTGETPDKYMQGTVIKEFTNTVKSNENWSTFADKVNSLIDGK
ncbi:hypothetical protein [Mesoplasma photuris]|uniref:hypothetical protein n=1 Tax=Mesoplasma photuris TaxID=217731 RepID=UPI0004E12F0F|nr:hypothetical protein [Mesoplasma photuris]